MYSALSVEPDHLMAGRAAVIADDEARYVHRFEVRQVETGQAGKIVVIPASVRRPD